VSLSSDKRNQDERRRQRYEQNRTQRIVMWCIFGVAAVLLVIAIVLLVVNGVALF